MERTKRRIVVGLAVVGLAAGLGGARVERAAAHDLICAGNAHPHSSSDNPSAAAADENNNGWVCHHNKNGRWFDDHVHRN